MKRRAERSTAAFVDNSTLLTTVLAGTVIDSGSSELVDGTEDL